tara:strand:+ start:1297 stop:2316 length:1020 start_codon:yes stop_codon:yes gene_type:complete
VIDFPREIGLKRAICKTKPVFINYVKNAGNKTSCYMSLYSFGSMSKPWKVDYTSAVLDKAWWDFDDPNQADTEQARRDAQVLIHRLLDLGVDSKNIRIVATGRGFHVYQLFKESYRGRDWSNALQRYERMMSKGLETLDGIGYPEKITRIPDTYNPKRSRWAVVVPINHLIKDLPIPNKPDITFKEYCPYRGEEGVIDGFKLSEWVKTHPVDIMPQIPLPDDFVIGSAGTVPIPPCLEAAISTSNPPHHVRVALVQHMGENLRWFAPPEALDNEQTSAIEDEIVSFISSLGWRDYNESITRFGVRTTLKYSRTPSCAWFVQRNLCVGKCWRYDGTVRLK